MATLPYTPQPATYEPEEPGSDRWCLNLGPQHPATHTTLRHVLELDGERVLACTVHIGYLHSGFEKLGEHLNYNQFVTVTDRMNYVSPTANNIAWHHACEALFGIEITPRCKAIRTLVAEMARIQDHLVCVGCSGLDLGGYTAFMYPFNARETIYDLIEEICGHRFTTSFTRLGGLKEDITPGWTGKVKTWCTDELVPAINDMEKLLTRNRIFLERTKGLGHISHDDAINWGLTGPLARASGVRMDLRKDAPYLCFADNWDGRGSSRIDFKVPVMTTGDCLARYLVRLEEIRQSKAIIELLADNIPEGSVNVEPDEKTMLPDKDELYSSIEGLIHHFEKIMTNRGFAPPVGEVYAANETANGELGFYVVSDGGNAPYRVRTRPPSLINYQCFPKLVVGHSISDVVAVLSGMNIIAGELDR
ncbi:MAG: NADH-quinone oxidoreductase subunit D [bacterium]|nr:NADH-quinone oxidoreductase subunit D [bacterium]